MYMYIVHITYNVGYSIDLRSGIEDEEFLGVFVSFEDCVDVGLVFLASLDRGTQ